MFHIGPAADRRAPRRARGLLVALLLAVAAGTAFGWSREPPVRAGGTFRMAVSGANRFRVTGTVELGKGSLVASAGQEATLILSRSDGPLGPGVHPIGPRPDGSRVDGLVIVGTPSYPRAVYRATSGVVSIALVENRLRGSFRIEGADAGRRMVASGTFSAVPSPPSRAATAR